MSCFAFNMKELGALIGPGIQIELVIDTPIFRCPYRYTNMEKDLFRSRTLDLLEVGLVELLHGKYASTIVMPAKKDVHGNYTNRRTCGDYRPINRQTKSDKYAMPTLKEIFDVVGHARVFNTLDLQAGYHQLPIREEDKAKTEFWGVNFHGKDSLYQWKFLPFGLKNAHVEFQCVIDRILIGLDFVRCYINDIVVYNDIVEEHWIHLQIVFERLKAHGLCLHPRKCKFF
jgi:putative transposase